MHRVVITLAVGLAGVSALLITQALAAETAGRAPSAADGTVPPVTATPTPDPADGPRPRFRPRVDAPFDGVVFVGPWRRIVCASIGYRLPTVRPATSSTDHFTLRFAVIATDTADGYRMPVLPEDGAAIAPGCPPADRNSPSVP